MGLFETGWKRKKTKLNTIKLVRKAIEVSKCSASCLCNGVSLICSKHVNVAAFIDRDWEEDNAHQE